MKTARRRRIIAIPLVCLCWMLLLPPSHAQVSVTTYHNDNARTGQNLQETILTPENVKTPPDVNFRQFGKLFSMTVDGQVYAQPLYVPNVHIVVKDGMNGMIVTDKGFHNVVFVVTEQDKAYAFDGDTGQPLWVQNLID